MSVMTEAANNAGLDMSKDVLGPVEQADASDPFSLENMTGFDSYFSQAAQVPQDYTAGNMTPAMTGGVPTQTGSVGDKIVAAAEKYLNVPYVWGGAGANGVDCSGLVMLAYKAAGINVPRISYQQANEGHRVDLKHARPGDLIAWDNSSRNPGADHIAIYLGNGRIIEAPHPGANVRIRTLGKGESYWAVQMGW